ncbi:hypothetical protein Bca52824_028649 [Brassica carinata]|uniref:Disease resistance R13L4/SHOC-2-like LRR domain-containing protein n=1 Tax=Brassica carinata TaxID=52824 RepID=A0A8X7VCV3_BRACI|nr:hypothetical protein Bca52824_028649 [Brassica carinata]
MTGEITRLELPKGCLRGTLSSNSSLFHLHHLRHLDLSYNSFGPSSVPSELGNLNRLEDLILSSNGFTGQIPSSFSNLSQLFFLDLSHNDLTGGFPLVQNQTKLNYLDISYNHLSSKTLSPKSSLFMLHHLRYLDLASNNFSFSSIPSEFGNLFRLEVLSLSSNGLTGQVPSLFSNLSRLTKLSLDHNKITGTLEPISKLTTLDFLRLSFLKLSYPFDLNLFSSLKSLLVLDFSGNSISPDSLSSDSGILLNLQKLDLSGCGLTQFPNFLKSLDNLEVLYLCNNTISGKVPEWMWKLPHLSTVALINNSFTGFEGSVEAIVNSSISYLDLALNHFKGPFPNPPHSLISLSAWNNSFTGNIPLSICNRSSLHLLDLSYNKFTGSIPPCLSNFQSSLIVVNLRKNNLEGSLPDLCYDGALLQTLDVGYNRLTGKLPRSLLNCSHLRFLSVDNNRIKDTFPFWLKALAYLQALTLRSNEFYGPMSPSDQASFAFPELRILEIAYNNFSGSLPSDYFVNWKASSLEEDGRLYMEDNSGDFFIYQDTIDLQYKGLFMEQGKILTSYATIDFSGNKLEGQIPESIGLLKKLIALNLSNNDFTGHIPLSLANVTELESLDLSRNQLSGTIPKGLEKLSFLAYISVAHNQLKGEIPQGTQITSQPESSFVGNAELCGFPLKESCFRTITPPIQQQEQEKGEQVWNWKAVAIGYGPGLVLGLSLGQVIASYMPEWLIKIIA